MVISKKYAQKLVRKGKATIDGRTTTATTWEDRAFGDIYRVVNRLDIQRVDHYKED